MTLRSCSSGINRANYDHVFLSLQICKRERRVGAEALLSLGRMGVCLVLLCLLAILNACSIIHKITRIAGETFGMLIAVLFIQEAIKGLINEFKIPKAGDPSLEKYQFQWLYTNGLLSIIFSFGLLYTALKIRRVRSWWCGTGRFRSLAADYGVPLMVLLWSAASFAIPNRVPSGVPRRLYSPLLWESVSVYHWTVIKDMAEVPPAYIIGAFIPAVMIEVRVFCRL